VVTPLRRGGIVKFTIGVDAHHAGHLELRLCPFQIDGDDQDISGCALLNRASAAEAGVTDCGSADVRDICGTVDPMNPAWWYLPPKNGMDKNHNMWFHIPANVDCPNDQCTVQFTWKTANSCNPHPSSYCNYYHKVAGPQNGWCKNWYCGGKCNSGSGEPDNCEATMGDRQCCSEVFTNCAEVSLSGALDGSAPRRPSPRPSPRPSKPAGARPSPARTPETKPAKPVADLDCSECKKKCSEACNLNNGRNQCWGSPRYIECTCSDGSQHSIPGCKCDPSHSNCPDVGPAQPTPEPEPEHEPSPTPPSNCKETEWKPNKDHEQAATDEQCKPCDTQSWWPCNVDNLCIKQCKGGSQPKPEPPAPKPMPAPRPEPEPKPEPPAPKPEDEPEPEPESEPEAEFTECSAISDENTCEAAASALSKKYNPSLKSRTRPKGCHGQAGNVYFNRHSKGGPTGDYTVICQGAKSKGHLLVQRPKADAFDSAAAHHSGEVEDKPLDDHRDRRTKFSKHVAVSVDSSGEMTILDEE